MTQIIRNTHRSRESGFAKDNGKTFEMIEDIIGLDEQEENVQGKNLTSLVPVRVRDDLPRVLASHPVITPKRSKECIWKHIGMNDLKEIKQAIVSYGLHSLFREMVRTWTSRNKVTPHD